jgi:hypothetical protein
MEQSPWEANSHSISQEIPLPLWNPKVHYRLHKQPATAPYLEPGESILHIPTLFT